MITLNYDPNRSFRVWNKNQIWLGQSQDNGGRIVPNVNDLVVETTTMTFYKVVAVDTANNPPNLPTYVPTLQVFVFSAGQIERLNHENLLGLLGGNNDGHYHLTHDEYMKIQNALNFVSSNGDFVFGRGFWNENVSYIDPLGSKVPDFVISRDLQLVYASARG